MARLWSCGFELQTISNGVEFISGAGAGSRSISTTTVHGGAASLLCNPSATAEDINISLYSSNTTGTIIYQRGYFNFTTFPTSATNFFVLCTGNLSAVNQGSIRMNTSHQLQLFTAAGAQIGSNSTTLSTGTWYRIELKTDSSTNPGTLEGVLEGVSFASGANSAQASIGKAYWLYTNGSTQTFSCFLDDIALNDNTGSVQNGYPGAGQIIHQLPNGAGDNTTWTPLASTNWSQVSEVTPDDDTSYNRNSVTLNQADDYTVSASGIPSGSTINVVQVGVRARDETATTSVYQFAVRIKKVTGGTISTSGNINVASTSYITNATNPRLYNLTLYNDPDGSPWTQSTLDTSQIGLQTTVTSTNRVRVTTEWMLVDYVPPTSTANAGFFSFM